jgi:O-antigen/teichoic acid export membrane protein
MAIDDKIATYLKSSGAGLISQAVTNLCGFAAIWVLNRILLEEGYGDYEFALALTSMLLILGSGGLQYVAMYRISRIDAEPGVLAGKSVAGALLGWSLLLSGGTAVGVAYIAPSIAALASKPELSFWIATLAFLIPIRVSTEIYRNWYRGRQLVAESLYYGQMAPAISRTLGLVVAWVCWSTPEGVVVAVVVGELIPLLGWYVTTPLNPFLLKGVLSVWDLKYALKLMFTRSLSLSVKRSDILMMGAIATSAATAGYVVAARLSITLLIAHQLMNLILTPRIGRFLSLDDGSSIVEEYHQSRIVAYTFSLVGGVALVVFGETVLGWFGEYTAAYPILLTLVATYVMHVSFGMSGGYLNIAGYAGWTLVTTASVLLINVGLNYVLIPIMGGKGAALAMLISFLCTNLFAVYLIRRIDQRDTYSWWLAGSTAIAISSLLLAANQLVPAWTAAAVLVSLIVVVVVKEYPFFESLAESLARLFQDMRVQQ